MFWMMNGWNRRMGPRGRMGFFPLGALLALPALMFGGWIAMVVACGVLGLAGSILGSAFAGLGMLARGVFSGASVLVGIVIGLAAFSALRKRNARED